MINIINKEDCNGCCACVDVCAYKAIELKTDLEGFWYPEVDKDLCTSCGLCEKICPEINADKVNNTNIDEPLCYAAHHKEKEIRLDSTSGGIFTALAKKMYETGGFVTGAIYNDDFSVRHIISNNIKDLEQIRSSKYLQSLCVSIYSKVKKLLLKDEKVLICGCPCQMAALRLFLDKDYDNLIICDFICRGINSPKIFRKHLDSLEYKYGSKIIYAKAKNKELGWRALTFKAIFENGKSYYGTRQVDNFTRGYLHTGSFCRPSCYDCKFKRIPRIADITLADFWGIEKIFPELDDNTGTSLILCNSKKGINFFDSIKDDIVFLPVEIKDAIKGNPSVLKSLSPPLINRDNFFSDVDKLPFEKVAHKYFPVKKKYMHNIINILKRIFWPFYWMGFHPKVWGQFIWINVLRKNSNTSILRGNILLPTPYCVFDINSTAKINVKGRLVVGFKKIKGSKLETRMRLEKGTSLIVNNNFFVYAGADIQLFEGGCFSIDGGVGAGCNINCQIICADNIHIGKGVLIGRNVIIRDYDAHYIIRKGYKVSAPIKIDDHCWIGEGVLISKGVKVGSGSVVAARSWVVTDVPPKTLISGTPAMPIEENITWKI